MPTLLLLALFAAGPSGLEGRWTVDLSIGGDGSYTQPMTLTLADDHTVTGEFYNSEILDGRWGENAGRVCVSFRTTDGAGPYHTAACLDGDRVEGQTWAEHRQFLLPWTATRAAD